MASPTDHNLRAEHREFLPSIEALGRLAERAEDVPPGALRASIDELHGFLAHVLVPHAVGEGRTVYPQVRKVVGADEVTSAMNRDHQEIARLTDELEVLRDGLSGQPPTRQQVAAVSRVLMDLHRLIRDHFEREEEVCCSAMEGRLSEQEGEEVLSEMRRTAAQLADLYE